MRSVKEDPSFTLFAPAVPVAPVEYSNKRARRVFRTAFRLVCDVTLASLVGMGVGACVDRFFPPDPTSESFGYETGLLLAQALLNGVVLFLFVKVYERVAADVDAYLGYSTFITLLYCCQPVFTTRAGMWREHLFPV